MQVRKYEATTIKEAVEMVKKDLGPDAIILSTKETQKHMGAHSPRKVLITAAVTEETYNRKRTVEQNLSQKDLARFSQKSARVQKQFINQAYSHLNEKITEKRRVLEERNYASIPEDDFEEESSFEVFKPKIKNTILPSKPKQVMKSEVPAPAPKFDVAKIDELKSEIKRLQSMLQNVNSNTKTAQAPASLYPGARHGISQDTSAMFEKLVGEGIDEKLVVELMKNAQLQLKENVKRKGLLEAWVAKWMYSTVDIVKEKLQSRYHVFVGPRGVGKTSSLVKMASHLVLKEKKRVGIISADNNKVGAVEQLKIYSQILNVPFAIWKKGEDINQYLKYMEKVDYVLIDTEGQSLLQMNEIDNLKAYVPYDLGNIRIHLVLSAMMKDEEMFSFARRFRSVQFHDFIMTNIDQLRKHGVLLNLQKQIAAPYFAFGLGPMIPEDFEWASRERILDCIFKLSKTKGDT
jgi:flagellar biosynthesis protein FlhF